MARLSNINAAAVKMLSKVVTFTSWKGIPVVKAKPKKYPSPRSPRVRVMNRRFRICWKLISYMDETVRDAYRYWAQGTSYTWKDLAVREILTTWQQTGQTPITLRHLEWELVDGELTLNYEFNPIMTDEGNGYGKTGWGISPWGSPPSFLTEEGYYTPAIWHLAYGDPIPWPYSGFTY